MIDDEANFDILDASEEVQAAAKFRPKQRAKPRKTVLSSRSAASNPTVENGNGKLGVSNQVSSSKELTSQERASLTCPGSETIDDVAGSQVILETSSDDVLTVPLGPPGGTSAADRISQDDKNNADSSKLATHKKILVVPDIQVSPASSCGKTIDDIVEFEELFGAQDKEERDAKFQPKVQTKLLKATKSQKTNQKVEASPVDEATQKESRDNIQTRLHYDQLQDPKCHGSVQTPDSEGLLATSNNDIGNLANLDSVLEVSVQEETIAKFRPKLRPKPAMVSSKVVGTNDNTTAATLMVGICAENNDVPTKPKDQETITAPATWSPQDVDATVDLDNHNELINSPIDGTQSMVGEVSAEATCKSQPSVGREKGKGKSVSFAMPDASGVVTPTVTNSEMDNVSDSYNDKLIDENLSNLSQQTVQKNSNDQEHNEGEPLDPPVEQQPKSGVGEIGSSMKLRSRKKSQKVGTHKDTDDYFDEDFVEPSLAEEDNDSGDDYTAGTTRKVRKKPRDSVEESLQQKVQKDKSQVSSRGRKRTLKDASAEKPEKKLTHRIRQSRAKEVKTLLEKPREEIDPMKLSAAHLRLLQEARERVNGKENPPEPSSNSSFQFDDMDDLDYRDEERNFDNDRTQNPAQNVTKLNYHSYMNKQTRGKWSKSDTDMFYKGLRQFGSDFAMIQQLLPDKTRHQVRAKFKTEEKKNPLLVHDAIIHRSGDNLYFKTVIKNLNIEDVAQQEINNTRKQDGASSERGPGKENVLDDFIHGEEDDSNWLDEEHSVQKPDVQEEEHASGNDDDGDLGDVFDWY
ncbi:hypothetical protein SETIT_1G142100v2 [Setaria italica]|uniref:Myb-like domain-containing protein n=1 Tax=Setaria italica TaxID=4555 RepID=A0A368PK50_SETIT|nr:uncharacterized protein LOC101786485 isoform X2 [Setaria italica]RCV06170.1 hypothetical protein SETIT_1G142100v2 [Setaria italica]RCV06171.1 hypothetical protein SETIT_1G142100v2 [Setaria italica]